mmetsp:Transcript_17378/g.40405  ORF Transcript_17378/g.40405 Transcript_17378/m.40405 type:complete len:223 (-) Transcript_17378:5611-6279(-)
MEADLTNKLLWHWQDWRGMLPDCLTASNSTRAMKKKLYCFVGGEESSLTHSSVRPGGGDLDHHFAPPTATQQTLHGSLHVGGRKIVHLLHVRSKLSLFHPRGQLLQFGRRLVHADPKQAFVVVAIVLVTPKPTTTAPTVQPRETIPARPHPIGKCAPQSAIDVVVAQQFRLWWWWIGGTSTIIIIVVVVVVGLNQTRIIPLSIDGISRRDAIQDDIKRTVLP